jgi:Tol biopolymer transport system component
MLLSGTHPGKLDVPVWSPDGKSIICASGNSDGGSQDVSIVEVRVSDWTAKELAADRFFRITKMAWLPDKSGLIMSARRNLGGNNQLWRVSYPGIEISQITEGLTSYLDLSIASSMDKTAASQATLISDIYVGTSREPRTLKRITQAIDKFCWAPDGRLVYTSTASGNRDLWIMEPDGSEQRQLTVNTAVNGSPAVTPDNRYIVFLSNRTGVQQVWRMDMDGSNQIQLTDGAGKDHPAISPDGKWVLYNTTDDWRLWRVSIAGGDPDRLTDYFAYRPSVSPDGEMIACTGRQESKREVLILPFEGGQPLKRLFFTEWSSRLQWTDGGNALIYGIERNGVTSLIKQSLDGGPPEEIIDFAEDELFDFGYSFDGQSLAVTRGAWQHDIVLINGLNQF